MGSCLRHDPSLLKGEMITGKVLGTCWQQRRVFSLTQPDDATGNGNNVLGLRLCPYPASGGLMFHPAYATHRDGGTPGNGRGPRGREIQMGNPTSHIVKLRWRQSPWKDMLGGALQKQMRCLPHSLSFLSTELQK